MEPSGALQVLFYSSLNYMYIEVAANLRSRSHTYIAYALKFCVKSWFS